MCSLHKTPTCHILLIHFKINFSCGAAYSLRKFCNFNVRKSKVIILMAFLIVTRFISSSFIEKSEISYRTSLFQCLQTFNRGVQYQWADIYANEQSLILMQQNVWSSCQRHKQYLYVGVHLSFILIRLTSNNYSTKRTNYVKTIMKIVF